jgi:hypothetical protein
VYTGTCLTGLFGNPDRRTNGRRGPDQLLHDAALQVVIWGRADSIVVEIVGDLTGGNPPDALPGVIWVTKDPPCGGEPRLA